MNNFTSKMALFALGAAFTLTSCQTEAIPEDQSEMNNGPEVPQYKDHHGEEKEKLPDSLIILLPQLPKMADDFPRAMGPAAVTPSPCGPTEFLDVQMQHLEPLYEDIYSVYYLTLYQDLSLYAAYYDESEQYFGENGEFTNLVEKRQRELESFYESPQGIKILGQHGATLNDREALADVYELIGLNINTREDAYGAADAILQINAVSPNLPETPFVSIDGFTTSENKIVLGDGLLQMISETGIDIKVAYTGVLAHEWAHQVQFYNNSDWYPNGASEDPAEDTRHKELEADFLASYYMTHKRGATYNWKKVEQFNELFFLIGDCSFDAEGHHGTPLQRMEAARLGYELANDAQKKGHILSEDEVHEHFLASLETILN